MPSDTQLPSEAANAPSSPGKNKKLGIIAAVGAVIGLGVYLYAKNKSSSASGTASANPTIVLPSGTTDTANSSVESALLPYLQSIGASLNTLSNQVNTQNQTGSNVPVTLPTLPNIPAPANNAVTNSYPTGTFGNQTAAAAPYATNQTIVGGNPYTQFAFPTGTTQQTIANDLYGNAPSGLGTLQQYDPAGSTSFKLPVYPGEPVVG
jgi:hypothetical protein